MRIIRREACLNFMELRKEYLGDSVYMEDNGFGVTLTTENGYGPNNTIVIEPSVIDAFFRQLQAWKQENQPPSETE